MKKLIAAALAILLGSTGYVIVDHTLEDRVIVLEEQAQAMSGDISSLNDRLNSYMENSEEESTFVPHGKPQRATYTLSLPRFSNYEEMIKISSKTSATEDLIYMHHIFATDTETPITFTAYEGQTYTESIYLNDALYFTCTVSNTDGKIFISNEKFFDITAKDLTTTTTTLPSAIIVK